MNWWFTCLLRHFFDVFEVSARHHNRALLEIHECDFKESLVLFTFVEHPKLVILHIFDLTVTRCDSAYIQRYSSGFVWINENWDTLVIIRFYAHVANYLYTSFHHLSHPGLYELYGFYFTEKSPNSKVWYLELPQFQYWSAWNCGQEKLWSCVILQHFSRT